MKYLFFFVFSFSINSNLFATTQVPDYMVYKGDTKAIAARPFEEYKKQVGRVQLIDFVGCGSTACYLGYVAVWELQNDSLFSIKITSCHKNCGYETKDANLEKMFGTNRVFAYWFTGEIRRPKGKVVQYQLGGGMNSIYEEDELFSFSTGKLSSFRIKSNKDIADKVYAWQYSQKMTKLAIDTAFYHFKKKMNWKKIDKNNCIFNSYRIKFDRKGKVKEVNITPWGIKQEQNEEYIQYNYEKQACRKKIKKMFKTLNLKYLEPEMEFFIEIGIFYNEEDKLLELKRPEWLKYVE